MSSQKKVLLPILLFFVFTSTFLLTAKSVFIKIGADRDVIIVANIICVALHIIVFLLQSKSLKSTNPNAFVRAVMAGMAIKMLACMIAVFMYVMLVKPVNKPAVLISLLLYFVYMAIEVKAVLKLNKQKNG